MIGIYIITNEVNEKVYIGQVGIGKNTFMDRFKGHLSALRKNKHFNERTVRIGYRRIFYSFASAANICE